MTEPEIICPVVTTCTPKTKNKNVKVYNYYIKSLYTPFYNGCSYLKRQGDWFMLKTNLYYIVTAENKIDLTK